MTSVAEADDALASATITEHMNKHLLTREAGKWFTLTDLMNERREAMGHPLSLAETEAIKAWWGNFNPSGALRVYPNGVIQFSTNHTKGYNEDFSNE